MNKTKREENLERLKALGLDGSASLTALVEGPAPEPEVAPVEPTPEKGEPQPVKPAEPVHNWEKRAQDAQSELMRSRNRWEREKADMQSRLDNLESILKSIEAPKASGSAEPLETVDDFEREYPDLAKAVQERSRREVLAATQSLKEEIAALRAQQDERDAERTLNDLIAKIQGTLHQEGYGRLDLIQIANSPAFIDWMDSHDPSTAKHYHDVMERSTAHGAAAVVRVLKAYLPSPKPKKTEEQPPRLPAAPSLRPDSGVGQVAKAMQPLTPDEFMRFNSLMAEAGSKQAREHLVARMRFTLSQNQAS